jgi:hypothetical protein
MREALAYAFALFTGPREPAFLVEPSEPTPVVEACMPPTLRSEVASLEHWLDLNA